MIMPKLGALLLAVSAMSVLVQSVKTMDPRDGVGPSDKVAGVVEILPRDDCIDIAINKLIAIEMSDYFNQLADVSDETLEFVEDLDNHRPSLAHVVSGKPPQEYRKAMEKVGADESCEELVLQFKGIYGHEQCQIYCDSPEKEIKFTLNVAAKSDEAKRRISAFYGCAYSFDGGSEDEDNYYDRITSVLM